MKDLNDKGEHPFEIVASPDHVVNDMVVHGGGLYWVEYEEGGVWWMPLPPTNHTPLQPIFNSSLPKAKSLSIHETMRWRVLFEIFGGVFWGFFGGFLGVFLGVFP